MFGQSWSVNGTEGVPPESQNYRSEVVRPAAMAGGQGGVEPPTSRSPGRNCLSGEVVLRRIPAQEKGFHRLQSGDSGARVSKTVSKLEPGGASSRPPDIPFTAGVACSLQLQV